MSSNKLIKALMIFVGVSGCFSVLCGAWLAHGGEMLPVSSQSRLATALEYQFIHTLALLCCLVWHIKQANKYVLPAAIMFFIGIICFSGSLYIKSFFDISALANLAPFGGISLAVAWLLLALAGKNQL
ncbi:DUF423 domain-containing protein [Thalassotalea sp. PLHSN55]|uniref:DUF423 domain-containing protein n=1 Tax=Thalassotalea sp. PLHSN55 TaxID=3435888 RepID=UPI003F836150